MTKEKKQVLYLDTNASYHEYDVFNLVIYNGNLIYYASIEKVATCEGQVFFSEDKIAEIVHKELDKRLGVLQQEK